MKKQLIITLCIFAFFLSCKKNADTNTKQVAAETKVASADIPLENLKMSVDSGSRIILENEIKGIEVVHKATTTTLVDSTKQGHKTIYLFVKGKGTLTAGKKSFELVPETILLPNHIKTVSIDVAAKDTLHFLKISSKLTAQDVLDLEEFPKENTKNVYYAKFIDCEPYTEPIKSPNTVSRTILPNKYIPRIAMGTVQTKGPDKVGFHEHPMLEQLFLGLANNNTTVYADSAQVNLPEFAVLHIPLGSSHAVSVKENNVMYYVWMDFFRDKKGEEWLKTHNAIKKDGK